MRVGIFPRPFVFVRAVMGRAYSPLGSGCSYEGLRPSLVWIAPLALGLPYWLSSQIGAAMESANMGVSPLRCALVEMTVFGVG